MSTPLMRRMYREGCTCASRAMTPRNHPAGGGVSSPAAVVARDVDGALVSRCRRCGSSGSSTIISRRKQAAKRRFGGVLDGLSSEQLQMRAVALIAEQPDGPVLVKDRAHAARFR